MVSIPTQAPTLQPQQQPGLFRKHAMRVREANFAHLDNTDSAVATAAKKKMRSRKKKPSSISPEPPAMPTSAATAATAMKPLSVNAEPFIPSPSLTVVPPSNTPSQPAVKKSSKKDPYMKLPKQGKPPQQQQPLKASDATGDAPATNVPTGSKRKPVAPQKPQQQQQPPMVKRWWHSLKDVDPITLFPLRNLKIEPFELSVSDSKVKHFFDCESLASYLLQTGKFLDPINRQPISRDECLRLDKHLRRFGLKELAKCVEMMDLQNSSAVTSSATASEERRRQQVVLASSLFQYPPLIGARPPQGGGGLRVTDDDEQFEYVPVPPPDHQLVEDDFPEMPLVRRRATADDFPPMSTRAARWVCEQCTFENAATSSRNTCEACGHSNATVAPLTVSNQQPSWPTSSDASAAIRAPPPPPTVESWRRSSASNRGDDDRLRPRLVLSAPSRASSSSIAAAPVRPESVFGKAKPVDVPFSAAVPAAAHMADSELEPDTGGAPPLLCAYSAKMVQLAMNVYGLTFVLQMERMLKELIEAGNCRRTISLEPMSEGKRTFVKELASRYYGMHCQECDPEPKRFLQISSTSVAFVPEVTLSRVMTSIPASRFQLNAASSSAGILLIGVQISPKQLSQSVLVNGLGLRESEFDIFWLESLLMGGGSSGEASKVCFVSIASVERARKACKRLVGSATTAWVGEDSPICTSVMFWPCGAEWARAQIRHLNLSYMASKKLQQHEAGATASNRLVDSWAQPPERSAVAAFAREELEAAPANTLSAAELGQRIATKFELAFHNMDFPERTLTQFLANETGGGIVRLGLDFVLRQVASAQEDDDSSSSDDDDSEEEEEWEKSTIL